MQQECLTGFSCVPEQALCDEHMDRSAWYKVACSLDQLVAKRHLL